MAKKNQLGVENLKAGFSLISSVILSTLSGDTNNDGEINSTERIQLIGAILPQLFPSFNLYGGIREEIEDKITSEEFDELVAYTQTLDFLPDSKEEAEKYVKRVFLWINYNRRFVKESIDFFQKKKSLKSDSPGELSVTKI